MRYLGSRVVGCRKKAVIHLKANLAVKVQFTVQMDSQSRIGVMAMLVILKGTLIMIMTMARANRIHTIGDGHPTEALLHTKTAAKADLQIQASLVIKRGKTNDS